MPDPIILQIADNLIAKSVAAGFVSTGLLVDVGKLWAEENAPPAAYVGIPGESSEPGPTRSMSPLASFFWHTIVKNVEQPTRDFMKKYKALKDLVDADPTLGGLVTGNAAAQVVGFHGLNTSANIAQRVHVADVFVQADYRHTRGAA